jgi:plasmid replication initiation protein
VLQYVLFYLNVGVMMQKLKKIQKSNCLNQANFSDFSTNAYKVVLNLIADIKRNNYNGERLELSTISREYSLTAERFSGEFGTIEKNHAYEILKYAVDKLLNTIFTIKTDRGILKMNVCSSALYVENEGRIDIRFTEEIMPHLCALNNKFTMYNLKEISNFNSIYTIRLYELLMQFKLTGEYVSTVDNLRYVFGCVDTLKQYGDFKKRTIQHAVDEINAQYKINLTYEEIKDVRKVVKLIFRFKKTTFRVTYDPVKEKYRNQLSRPEKIKKG